MGGVQLSKGYSPWELPILIYLTYVGCKAELTLNSLSGFETGNPELGIQYLNF